MIDEQNRLKYVSQDTLAEWSLTRSGLREIALENLEKDSAKIEIGRYFDSDDGLAASRALCPRFMKRVRDAMDCQQALVSLPASGSLLAWVAGRVRDEDMVAIITPLHETVSHPLSTDVFSSDDNGLSLNL